MIATRRSDDKALAYTMDVLVRLEFQTTKGNL
jgi:hypothetical protein